MNNKAERKVAIVTGASSGIGAAIKKGLEEKNYYVYNLSIDIVEDKDENLHCDVSKLEDVQRAVEEVVKRENGKIDLLVNNAGYGISGASELIEYKQIEGIFGVNFYGALYMMKECLKHMERGAKIINIASACALFNLPFRSYYCATKSALNMLTLSMRMELNAAGIELVSVCPGDAKTNFTKNRKKDFKTNERYGNRVRNAAIRVDKNDDKRMPATRISDKVIKIALKKKNKPLYIVSGKIKMLNFVSKIIPLSLLMKFTEKMYGGFKEEKSELYMNETKGE